MGQVSYSRSTRITDKYNRMTNLQIIRELRAKAQVEAPGTLSHLLNEAADRIEYLDERVAIVTEAFK